MFPVDGKGMERQTERLGKYLLGINLAGLMTGVAFYLLDGVLAGLAGFLIGLLGSALLVRQKNTGKNGSAGVLEELC